MAKYRKKPVVVEATRWFRNGDHSEDNCELVTGADGVQVFDDDGKPFLGEGEVVRRYRAPHGLRCINCHCETPMSDHGWIDTREGGHTVCPGDWIITDARVIRDHRGYHYPCKPDVFEMTYDLVGLFHESTTT